jgi:hypothetical protein
MVKGWLFRGSAVAGLALGALAACGGGGSSTPPDPDGDGIPSVVEGRDDADRDGIANFSAAPGPQVSRRSYFARSVNRPSWASSYPL